MSFIASLIGFNLLILAHELGHYGVARCLGIHARTLSVGFGPTVLSWVGRHTQYRLCLLPIGGYVHFGAQAEVGQDQKRANYDGLSDVSRRKRMLVTLGGPLANVILAMLVYGGLFAGDSAVVYQFQREQTTHLSEVGPLAEAAGLRERDLIVSVDGRAVRSFGEVSRLVSKPASVMRLTVARAAQSRPLDLEPLSTRVDGLRLWWPRADERDARVVINLGDVANRARIIQDCKPTVGRFGGVTTMDSIRLGVGEAVWVVRVMGQLVGKWFDGTEKPAVQSVVKMTQASARSFERGWAWFLSLLALFSMNLAVLNLLPLPGLDGGRLSVDVLETVSGHQLPASVTRAIHGIGMLLLLGFIAVVMVKEVLDLLP
jgi:regulator of sigma E protease